MSLHPSPHSRAKRLEIARFIRDYTARKGFPPTVDEIKNEIGVASKSTVHSHLLWMQSKGWIKNENGQPRTLVVLIDPDDLEEGAGE